MRLANDFHSSSQLAVPVMLTPPSQQKHVGWEGLLAFSKASGCSGVVAGAHSLVSGEFSAFLFSALQTGRGATEPSVMYDVLGENLSHSLHCT